MVSVRGILTRRKITVLTVVAAVGAATALASPVVGRILSFPLDDTVKAAAQAPNSSAVTLRYHCGFPVIGSQPMLATVEWNTPAVVQVGRPVPSLALSVQATISSQVVLGLNVTGVATFDGSADVNSVVRAPQGDISEKVTLNIPRAKVPSSGSMTVPADGSTPVVTFDQAGPGQVSAGAVTMHLRGYSAGGSPGSPFDVGCTLDPGQSDVVATFDITAAGVPSSASSNSTTQAPASPSGTPSHQPTSSGASTSTASGAAAPTPPANATSASSVEAIAPLSTSGGGTAGSAAPAASTDPTPALAAVEHASTAGASAAGSTDKGMAVTDWLLITCALLVAGAAGVFAASRLKKRRERAAHP